MKNLPSFLFAVTATLNLVLMYLDLPVWVYEKLFTFINEWIGTSVIFNISMAYNLKRIDPNNRIALIGLFGFNAINIFFMSVEGVDYEFAKMLVIHAIILIVGGYLVVRPLLKKYGR